MPVAILYGVDGGVLRAVHIDSAGDLQVDVKTYLGKSSYNNVPWGYNDVYGEKEESANLSAGNNFFAASQVPGGEVWVITGANIKYTGTAPTTINMSADIAGTNYDVFEQKPPVSGEMYNWYGNIYLKADDRIRFFVEGATATDDFIGRVWGYKMKVA